MGRTKLVTAYWMDIYGPPYYGAVPNRKERYLGSLISHARIGVPLVCYTHERNLEELTELKVKYNLENLEIKVKELSDIKYADWYERIKQENRPETFSEIDGRPPEVLWGKFDVMEIECTNSDHEFVYWIDVGLQHVGLFPWWTNPNREHPDVERDIELKFNGSKVLNKAVFDALEGYIGQRVATLVSVNRESSEYTDIEGFTAWLRPRSNPIAGFFGGGKQAVLDYCACYWDYGVKHLEKGILCHEQSIMKHVHNTFDTDKLYEFQFETHQYHVPLFHDKLWESPADGLKPVYRCFVDMAVGQNYTLD